MIKIYISALLTCTGLLSFSKAHSQELEIADSCTACAPSKKGTDTAHSHYILFSKPPALKLVKAVPRTEPFREQAVSEEKQITAIPAPGGKVSISVNGLESQNITISVYNIIGNLVFSATFRKDTPETITVSLDKHFAPGIYVVTGTSGSRLLKQQKLMIN